MVNGELELKDDDLEFRGRHLRRARRPSGCLKKVDKELEEDRQCFEALDRRVFLVYYQMALQADDRMAREFFERYDFHLTRQDIHRKLNAEGTDMEATLHFLSGRREQTAERVPPGAGHLPRRRRRRWKAPAAGRQLAAARPGQHEEGPAAGPLPAGQEAGPLPGRPTRSPCAASGSTS